jgi:hypothetical protein
VTGFYAFQVQDDELFGVPIEPDGRQIKTFQLGPVLAYDMPQYQSSMKVKAITSLETINTVKSWGFGLIKKF